MHEQIIKKIISRMLRDQNCLPLGLELLNYDIRFVNLDEDITVFRGIDTIYINKNSNFLKSRDIEGRWDAPKFWTPPMLGLKNLLFSAFLCPTWPQGLENIWT